MPQSGKISARPIYVYLPQAAAQDRRRRFPVLYCHDGQNLWDDPHCCFGHGGWYLNRIVDELVDDDRIEPLIIVGIPNSQQRYKEYTPGKSFADIRAHPYAHYVHDVVKPYVDRHFRSRKDPAHTGLLGSSLGGLMSLWMAHHFAGTFGNVASLSGAFEPKDRARHSFLDFLKTREHQSLRIYLDAGTVRDGAKLTRAVRDTYVSRGWQAGVDLLHHEEKGAEHNERCWRDRVWRALVFLYGKKV